MSKNQPQENLFIQRKTLLRFAQKQPSPFYLYDENTIRKRAGALTSAFSFSPFRAYFPVAVNPNPQLLTVLHEEGFGVWCENEAELLLCKKLGFSGEKVRFAPYVSMPQAEELAVSMDATFVITAPHALPQRPVRRVILSYKMQGKLFSGKCFYTTMERAKQGFTEQELIACAEHCRQYGTESFGIMLRAIHTERQSGYLSAVAGALFTLAARIRQKTGIAVSSINFGDGLYCTNENSADAETEIAPIQVLRKKLLSDPCFAETRLETTVGKWLLSDAGIFITKVAAIFNGKRPLLITEAAGAQFADFSKLGAAHEITVLQNKAADGFYYYDVCGSQYRHRGNFIDQKLLPTCSVGDYLVFHSAGASCRVLSQPLLGYPPCPEFLLTANGKIEQI